MTDANHIKVHPHGGRCEGRESKGLLNMKLHFAVVAHGKPVQSRLIAGTTADYSLGTVATKKVRYWCPAGR